MDRDSYVEHYNAHYAREGKAGSGQQQWKPQYAMWLKIGYKQGMTILDYGCGYGVMAEAVNNRRSYLGVDIAREAINLAKKEFSDVDFRLFEMGKLKCKPKDFIVAQSVFTHTPKIYVHECLSDIKRSLKPKGFGLVDVIIGEDNPTDPHVRMYETDEWLDYLWKAGLKGKYVGEIDWPSYVHSYYRIEHDD